MNAPKLCPSSSSGSKRERYRLVLVDSSHGGFSAVKASLQRIASVEIAAETTAYALSVPLVERHAPDFVLISTATDLEQAAETIAHIRQRFRTVRIVALGCSGESGEILRCFRAGADEYLVQPYQPEQILAVLAQLRSRERPATGEEIPSGRVFAFWGSLGGCGTTTVAYNTAYLLSKQESTLLADFHFGQGDLSLHLDIQPNFSPRDAWENPEELDDTLLGSLITKHPCGLHLLIHPFDAPPVFPGHASITATLQILERRYSHAILDLGHDDALAESVAPFVSAFFITITQTVPSLYLAVRKLRLLNRLGFDSARAFIVVSRYKRRAAVSLRRIQKALCSPKILCIREDEKRVVAAMNQGVPLGEISRRGAAYRDVQQLVDTLRHAESSLAVPVHTQGRLIRELIPQTREDQEVPLPVLAR
ncbi:MAG TPA: hypothetical protein PLG59_09075 [bacterium]|nr:hypothetical protein [bacterium]HQO34800.1 hypothetical protein [bacterium]HQP98248.1 hypothetical protein [bacterium]